VTRNTAVYESLRTATAAGQVVFALACAERGRGIFEQLADEREKEWFSHILEMAWKAPLGVVDEEELAQLVDEFQERAESVEDDDSDDSHSKDFYVLQSAMLAVNALALYMNPSPDRAEMSGQTLQTLLGSFDFRLSGRRPVVVGAGEAGPPVGRLQQMEQDAQVASMMAVAALAERERPSRQFLDGLQETCRPLRDEIASAAAAVTELAGWDESCA